ncbi:MAG TPA: AfsA-related hotdog domain-containing protein [Pseudonocardiaceae bacterium]
MSITPDGSPAPELSFAGTVDLALLHRRNPDEAFLTDAVQTGPHNFVAAALLPPGHPHYAAQTGPSRDRDPMLLLECARQAETYAAHAMFGVEPDARFVLRNWSAEFAGAPAAVQGGGPTELVITAVTGNRQLVRDRLRGLDYDLQLWVTGAWAGRVRMAVGYLSGAAYTVLRQRKHNGPPPSSDDLTPTAGSPVAPSRIGRRRATDAVLLDVESRANLITARLRIPAENPSLFDHTQDHVPAMVLVEAARQLAALATHEWGGAPPDRTGMAAMSSSFGAYAELTEPVELTATPVDGRSVEVTFRQAGTDIAQARITMSRPARATERGRGPRWLVPRS